MIYLVAAIAGMAGFLFGFDEGVIAGALSLLRAQFGIDPVLEGVVTAAVPFGALFGSLAAGRIAETRGRRHSLLLAGGLFVVGALLAALATGAFMLTLARLVLGLAIGIAAIVAPLYISENAPAGRRGMLVSIYQLAVTLGILGAYLVGYAFSDSWRSMFALGMVPGLALAVGILLMPDTPRWLAARGRLAEARAAIARVRGAAPAAAEVEAELAAIRRAAEGPAGKAGWADLLAPSVRPALIVGVGLFVLQQLSGINAVIYFAPTVFQHSGFDSHATQLLATIGIGLVNTLMTFAGMALIDRIGRRALLFLGFAGTAAGPRHDRARCGRGAALAGPRLHRRPRGLYRRLRRQHRAAALGDDGRDLPAARPGARHEPGLGRELGHELPRRLLLPEPSGLARARGRLRHLRRRLPPRPALRLAPRA